ncbi:hypothetical protein BDL97_09G071200, partial [Sphagnum fallax]
LQLLYQFDQSKINWFTTISLVLTLMCGIHSCLALGMTFNSWNNLPNITTLPTILSLIHLCTFIETKMVSFSITLQKLISQQNCF